MAKKKPYIIFFANNGVKDVHALNGTKLTLQRSLTKKLDEGLGVLVVANDGELIHCTLVYHGTYAKGERDIFFKKLYYLPALTPSTAESSK